MKKLILFAVLALAAVGVQAQHNCGSKSHSASTTSSSVSDEAAAQAASLDGTIDRRVCETSGKVSYYKKDVCEKSGKVSFSQVQYDAATSQFVNVAPSSVSDKKSGSCCASKGASASATSGEGGSKASCAGKTSGSKACCAGKKAKGSSASVESNQSMVEPSAKKVNN